MKKNYFESILGFFTLLIAVLFLYKFININNSNDEDTSKPLSNNEINYLYKVKESKTKYYDDHIKGIASFNKNPDPFTSVKGAAFNMPLPNASSADLNNHPLARPI